MRKRQKVEVFPPENCKRINEYCKNDVVSIQQINLNAKTQKHLTNLDRNIFPLEEIKELYNKRWGIETSFRQIKYAIGLHALHSKKRKSIQQEIKIPQKKRKCMVQINFTRASHIIRKFLNKRTGGSPPVESLIAKEMLPIRPGRTNARYVSAKKVVCFNYRFD